jgi:ATP-dependent helicase/DNAse subunit B
LDKGTVFITPLGARGRRASIFERIVACSPDRDYSSVLYITPSAFSLREAGRKFLSYLKREHRINVYVPFRSAELKSMCSRLFHQHENERIIPDSVSPLILCEVLGEKNIGYARLLSDLLGKIRHFIPFQGLSFIKENIISLIFEEKTRAHAEHAIEILERYEKGLQNKMVIDYESALIRSISLIKENIGTEVLVLDGFYDPTPLECELIKVFIENSGTVFILADETAEFLQFLVSLEKSFETVKLKSSIGRKNAGYYAYPSMEDEVEGIAKRIKGQILEGVASSEIVISSPALAKYIPMLRRVFKKFGIPVDITGYDLSSTGVFIALEEMIAAIEGDYPRNEFLSFLSSSYFPNIPDMVRDLAVSFSYKAGIVKGRQSWLSISKILTGSIDEEMFPGRKKICDDFQRRIKRLISNLEALRIQEDFISFIEKLEETLTALGFYEAINSMSGPSGEELAESLDKLFSDLMMFAGYYGTGEVSIEKSGLYLRHLIGGLKGNLKNSEGVRIVPFELAAGLEPKALFCCGMIEGELPSRPPVDPVLPENVKKILGLPFLEYYLQRQERYFKRILHSSHDEPCFSYPAAEGDTIFLPSPFLDWNMSLLPPVMNISAEDEVLVREGAIKGNNFPDALWNGQLVFDAEVKKYILRQYGPASFCRVTEIEAYRQCPLRFYIEKFLNLERDEAPKYEVEARLWGTLAHKTMEYLLEGADMKLEIFDTRLIHALDKALKELSLGDFWAAVARMIFQKLSPLLKESEISLGKKGFMPYILEKKLKVKINGLGLKGKVDRIDRKLLMTDDRSEFTDRNQQSTVNDQLSTVILLDYKTGSVDRESLQLPLYACMWQNEHAEPVEKTGFYSLRSGEIDWLPKKADMESYVYDAVQEAEDIILKIRKGVFSPLPSHEGMCRFCSHSSVCKGAK